ncbi:hypothetical protein VSX61_09880 [Brenneria populi subsp. brevivirga]|uniref:hypothetical protein n=1 Tax=Brenneria populi TaxID=1505588 RepID=UPI002E1769A8|nr:hypothetical protein [Brenneria populi subsp. brevivirga]
MRAEYSSRRWLRRLTGLLLGIPLSVAPRGDGKFQWDAYARVSAVRLQTCFNADSETARRFRTLLEERRELHRRIPQSGIVIRVWIDACGNVSRFSAPVMGDLRLEELMRDIVLALKPPPPPDKMPMPLRLVVRIPLAA